MNKNCAEYDVVNNFQFVEKRMATAVLFFHVYLNLKSQN